MDNTNQKKQLGQAVIELTMAMVLICTVVILASKSSVIIKNKFKHDFIEPSPKDPDFRIQVGNDFIFFRKGHSKNLENLKNSGWKFDKAIPAPSGEKPVVIMTKGERSILVTEKLGVLL